ncbi:MAG: hypothetical protein U5N85_13965 [Arcicella sp.]|nr:hypothetical protein [Arcicella sp.]
MIASKHFQREQIWQCCLCTPSNGIYDGVNMMIAQFQNTMMRVRYSSIIVVVYPHTLALGGGCEINLHDDRVVAAAENVYGTRGSGRGLIPAGGGTKEMAVRFVLICILLATLN